MTLNTYLTFTDNCREAFEFYRSVFGGDFSELQTFGDVHPTWVSPKKPRTDHDVFTPDRGHSGANGHAEFEPCIRVAP